MGRMLASRTWLGTLAACLLVTLVPGAAFAAPPTVATLPATSPDGYNWTFHGTGNNQNLPASYHFEYTYLSKTPPGIFVTPDTALPASVDDQGVSVIPPGPLVVNVIYKFRIVASNADGSAVGEYGEFHMPHLLDCILASICPFPSWRAPLITGPKKQRLTTRKKKRVTRFAFCPTDIILGPVPPSSTCFNHASFAIAFYCSVDGKTPQLCQSPFKARLAPGVHRFRVFATAAAQGAQSETAESLVRIRRAR